MLSYKEDNTLPNKVITLFNGEQEYRSLCTKILGEYYVKNIHCFEVDGKWYRPESGLIFKDYQTKVWFLRDNFSKRLFGIVDFKDGNPIFGYFTINPYDNVSINNNRSIYAINAQILSENDWLEDISTGIWYDKKIIGNNKNLNLITNKLNHQNKGYNIEDNEQEFLEKKDLYNKYKIDLTKDVRKYARLLGDTSFGWEIECSHGWLPDNLQSRMGIVVCRDGSLADENGRPGPEFTTIPFEGAKGLQTTVNISNELKKRVRIDTKCSLHLHLGNLPTSRLFLVSSYILGIKIQDELFKMFPYYKTDYTKADKEKDYCKKLKKMNMGILKASTLEEFNAYINNNYEKIFYWLSQNQNGSGYIPSKDCNRSQDAHPVPQKWNRLSRYSWLNLLNALFSSRNTVEFRLHTPTVNSQKIINWLFICNAIAKYAILHSREILTSTKKISLNEVLDYYKNTFRLPQAEILSNYLKAYVKERTDYFTADYKKGDYISPAELEEDRSYTFKFENTTHLF